MATYRTLIKHLHHAETMKLLETRFSHNLHILWLKPALNFPAPDEILMLSKLTKIDHSRFSLQKLTSLLETGSRLRGIQFVFEFAEPRDSPGSLLHISVKKCFFHDFFQEKQLGFLTRLFCSAELKMLESAAKSRNLEFDSPKQKPDGAKYCHFRFNAMTPLYSDTGPVVV